MSDRESWATAFSRILREVEVEMPTADEADQYMVYRLRCQQWKAERGIK